MIRPYGRLGSIIQGTEDYLPFDQIFEDQPDPSTVARQLLAA
jgi:hypothetical protein